MWGAGRWGGGGGGGCKKFKKLVVFFQFGQFGFLSTHTTPKKTYFNQILALQANVLKKLVKNAVFEDFFLDNYYILAIQNYYITTGLEWNVFVQVFQKVVKSRVIVFKISSKLVDFDVQKIIHYVENKNRF